MREIFQYEGIFRGAFILLSVVVITASVHFNLVNKKRWK